MPKRKVTSESGKTAAKKLKGEESSEKTSGTHLSFDSPQQCFLSLIYPKTIEEFFANSWEKEPLHIQRKNAQYYGELFTKAELEEVVKREKLEYDADLFVSRFSKNDERPCIDAEGKATVKSLRSYLNNEKATVMLSRPHRFNKELHSMVQLLESYFGNCVYAHLEVTPPDSQGHAPCYLGKEVFILQFEGKKCWRSYKPIVKLATQDSDDLDESEIGDVQHEYILEPGDLLYIPRGTVCQAASLPEQHSTDISLELSEENTWGHFLSTIVEKAVTHAAENDVSFREGLPRYYLSYMGYGKKESSSQSSNVPDKAASEKGKAVVPALEKGILEKQKSFEEKLKSMLSSLAQYVDPHWGADYLGTTFIGNRLPPFPESDKPNVQSDDKTPDDESMVQMTYPEHVRIVLSNPGDGLMDALKEPGDDDDDDAMEEDSEDEDNEEEEEEKVKKKNGKSKTTAKKDKGSKSKDESEKKAKKSSVKTTNKEAEEEEEGDEDDEGMEEDLDDDFSDKPCIIVQHTFHNDDSNEDSEMIPGFVKFPVHYSDALLILHRSTKPVAVKDLPLLSEERVELVVTLWSEGLLEVKES